MRLALASVLAALALAAPVSAAPFGELPFMPVYGAATCLRATGAPGELVRSSPSGARFMQVSAAGVSDAGTVVTGVALSDCPQAAARPDGAGVLAQAGAGLWVATRDPGGAWGAPARVDSSVPRAAVAVADSGAAVVAWVVSDGTRAFTVKAARRAAGGALGPAAVLGTGRSAASGDVQGSMSAAIAADGAAIVLWTQPRTDGPAVDVEASIAPAGGAFGAPQKLGESAATSAPALAAAPDGRALAVFWTGDRVQLSERAPGAAFGAPVTLAAARDLLSVIPAVAIGPGGAAAVAWTEFIGRRVRAATRAGAGAFGPPVTLASHVAVPELEALLPFGLLGPSDGPLGFTGADPDAHGGDVRAALTGDGRALVTWGRVASPAMPFEASLPLAGGHVDHGTLGAGIRQASSLTPLVLPGGREAVAWTDNRAGGDGRVHVAVEGVARPGDPPAPRVSLGRPKDSVLRASQSLVLPLRCSAACDVRLTLPDRFGTSTFVSLPHGGRRTVSFAPELSPIAPARPGPVRVLLRYGAPGAYAGEERTDTVTLRRAPSPRAPRVSDLRAVRQGDAVVVTWRTDVAAASDTFAVVGTAGRAATSPPLALGAPGGGKARRFRVRLAHAGGVRFVKLGIGGEAGTVTTQIVRVR